VWASEWSAAGDAALRSASEKFENLQVIESNANVRQIHGRKGEGLDTGRGDKIVCTATIAMAQDNLSAPASDARRCDWVAARRKTASYPTSGQFVCLSPRQRDGPDRPLHRPGLQQERNSRSSSTTSPGRTDLSPRRQVAKAAAGRPQRVHHDEHHHAANEHLYKKLPYDPVKDFAGTRWGGRQMS